jgi:predicted nucleotidyltransferase component of viral defense system
MLGPDYLDFAKADIVEVKENRFTVNLANETKTKSQEISYEQTTLLEEDE